MNPSSAGIWCNPPPPGTDEDLSNPSKKDLLSDKSSPERLIDPFLKSSEYIKYKLEHRRRSRSRSRSRHRHRHRSKSRGRHKHRRRRYSSSRSRSRSRRRHKRNRHSRSHSRSRSRSKSHRARRRRSRSRRRSRTRSRTRSRSHPKPEPQIEEKKEEEEVEEEEEEEQTNENVFKNDGSFMEMFKKMQEEQKKKEAENLENKSAPQPIFGKRRGGKVLKTGMVQKNKTTAQEEADAQDAWTLYMKEVKRYKEACCDDDSKTRLLVK